MTPHETPDCKPDAPGVIRCTALVRRWVENWKRACRGAAEWRRDLKRDGEINMLITSYVFAPLMWAIAVAVVTYYTLKSPNEKTETAPTSGVPQPETV